MAVAKIAGLIICIDFPSCRPYDSRLQTAHTFWRKWGIAKPVPGLGANYGTFLRRFGAKTNSPALAGVQIPSKRPGPPYGRHHNPGPESGTPSLPSRLNTVAVCAQNSVHELWDISRRQAVTSPRNSWDVIFL
jgi:hypothetical protein